MGDDFLDLPALGGHSEILGLLRAQVDSSGGYRLEQFGTLAGRSFQLGKESPGGTECGVVGGRAEAIDRLGGERARLTFSRNLFGGLADFIGEGRDDGAVGDLSHARQRGHHRERSREESVGNHRRGYQRHPPYRVSPDPARQTSA
jgi:hypothetical protein